MNTAELQCRAIALEVAKQDAAEAYRKARSYARMGVAPYAEVEKAAAELARAEGAAAGGLMALRLSERDEVTS
jgi:hypothetical protein